MAGTTLLAARDEIYSAVGAAWTANAATIMGAAVVPLLNWHDVGNKLPADTDISKAWARAVYRGGPGRGASIGGRRYRNLGTFAVQIFVPFRDSSSTDKAALLGTMLANALKLHAGEVEFFEVSQRDIGFDGPWYQLNVTAEAQFDEFNPA